MACESSFKRGFRWWATVGASMLAGCQAPGTVPVFGSEKAPEQFRLSVTMAPAWVPQGILASVPTHLGRHYADHGSLELRVATVRNDGSEPVEFFPWFAWEGERAAVELDHRMLPMLPRHRHALILFGDGNPQFPAEPPGDLLVNYRAEFDVDFVRVAFPGGGVEAISQDWRTAWESRGVRLRGGETAEIRLGLRLRPGFELAPTGTVPGIDPQGVSHVPLDVKPISGGFHLEFLVAQLGSVAPGLLLAARRPESNGPSSELSPLFLGEPKRIEFRTLSPFARETKNWDLPLPTIRYRFSRLPILL